MVHSRAERGRMRTLRMKNGAGGNLLRERGCMLVVKTQRRNSS